MDRVRSKTIPSGNSYVHLFFHLKTLGFSMFFEGKAYYFVGKEGWDEAANGATKKDLTDVKQ